MNNSIHVAAAAIFGQDGRLLIAKRPEHVHQGGLWEFPGGKLEAGESVEQALCRELEEELGIRPLRYRPLIQVPYRYPDKTVLLDVWRVLAYSGAAEGKEGQPLRWIEPAALVGSEFPAANRPIIDALQLPDRYLITGAFDHQDDFLARLQQALQAGVPMVQLRAGALERPAFIELARRSLALCRRFNARLIVNGDPLLDQPLDVDGIHLSAAQLKRIDAETLEPWRGKWIGASCHNEVELQRALDIGARYVSLSPVQPTASHPGAAAMGWERFQALVEQVPIPVYALGGMQSTMIEQVVQCGGQGIAAIREFWD